MSIDFHFVDSWAYIKPNIIDIAGEPAALESLRAAVQKILKECDPDMQAVRYLQYLIICDVYYAYTRARANYNLMREFRLLHEPMIEKEILLELAADPAIGLDALALAIETNAREYRLSTQPLTHEYRPSTQPQLGSSPASVPQPQGPRIQQQTMPAPSFATTPSLPPTPAGRLANSRWATAGAGAPLPAAGQSAAAPAGIPIRPKIANIGEAQAVQLLVEQSMQQKVRDELEATLAKVDGKQNAPPAPGLDPWEIPIPPAVDPAVSIKPYQRVLEDLLGVHLLFKPGRRLVIGESNFSLTGRPDRVRAAAGYKRRLGAWNDMMAYVSFTCERGVAPDVAQFVLSRQHAVIDAMKAESAGFMKSASKEIVTKAKVIGPAAPQGDCLKYCEQPRAQPTAKADGGASASQTGKAGGGEVCGVPRVKFKDTLTRKLKRKCGEDAGQGASKEAPALEEEEDGSKASATSEAESSSGKSKSTKTRPRTSSRK
ncbi:hypothetical protein DL765_004951 [Monosporascus sp. GIB2]|nr:hypothetical protein DL765_004951 [Monosporascus sp. GIB2]